MAVAMIVDCDDYHYGIPVQASFFRRAQKATTVGTSSASVWSEGMVELDSFRERNSVTMKAGGKVFASPAYEPASDDSSSLNRKSMSLNADVRKDPWRSNQGSRKWLGSSPIAFPAVAEMSKEERRELRNRLRRELEQIRSLSMRIELREQQLRCQSHSVGARPSLSDAQFSGNDVRSCVGKEVTSELDITPVGASFPFQRDAGLARQHSFSSLDHNHADPSLKEKRTPKANQLYRNADFVMGKDKMPPIEKPKAKPGVGSKRAALSRIDSRDSKRLSTDKRFQTRQLVEVMRQCLNLLKKLMNHKHGWVFNEPVDTVKFGLSDYHLIVKKPMDLGTVKGKLSRKEYTSPIEFANDVRLTFSNAMTYNPPGDDVHIVAASFLKLFEEKWKVIENKYEQERIRNEGRGVLEHHQPESSQLLPPHQSYLSQKGYRRENCGQSQARPKDSSGKKLAPPKPKQKPKPKIQLPKREMAFVEKKRLSGDLQLLPADKLEYIVQLMKERNPNLSQKDDEIEVDIDTFDNDTLWELHRYVTNCMKNISKNKKKAAQNQPENLRALKNQVVEDSGGSALARGRKGEAGDEDVDIDDDLPNTNFPPVEIEKDACYASRSSSSGSSSSESGSSSDSDSGSSSGSDSDAEDAQSVDRRR
eukprot:c28571_g1_i2 orf=474-2414(+)